MDNEKVAHDLALIAAKIKIQSNLPEYKVKGFEDCVSDLLADYTRAKEQILGELDNY